MKISNATLKVVKNATRIQQGISFSSDADYIVSFSAEKGLLSNCPIEETFPVDFNIYDSGKFLSVVSLFKDPEFTFSEDNVTISEPDGSSRVVYHACGDDTIKKPPMNELELEDIDVTFTLENVMLNQILKSGATMKLDDIRLKSEGDSVYFQSYSHDNDTNDTYSLKVLSDYDGPEIDVRILMQSLALMPNDYDVSMGKLPNGNNGFLFTSIVKEDEQPQRYWVVAQTDEHGDD